MACLPVNFVRGALAAYLDLNPIDIDPGAELERDLGLEPLDLVLVLFRLEQFADAGFSISDLEGVVTVADFEALVHDQLREAPLDDVEDEGAGTKRQHVGSGTHVLASKKVRATR